LFLLSALSLTSLQQSRNPMQGYWQDCKNCPTMAFSMAQGNKRVYLTSGGLRSYAFMEPRMGCCKMHSRHLFSTVCIKTCSAVAFNLVLRMQSFSTKLIELQS